MKTDFKCSAPWEGMFINPDGDFRFCCSGQVGSIGNLNKNSLQELLDGPVKRVQDDMLTKGYSDYCTNCVESENKSGKSLRECFSKDFTNVDTTKFIPKQLDIRWRNTCQLRCGYCNSEWSSAYAQWEGKNYKVSEINWQTDVLNHVNEYGNLHVVNFLGGEPLLLKENVDLINMMPDHIRASVVTNLSLDDIESLPVYQKLIKRQTSWLVSLDAIGNKFEYIRRNAKWNVTQANYERLYNDLPKDSSAGLHITYCIQSAFSLVEVFDWLYSIDPDPNNNTTFPSVLLGPKEFSIYSFPSEFKLKAIEELDAVMSKHGDFINQRTIDFISNTKQSLLDSLESYEKDSILRFIEYVKRTDSELSPISFAREWPQIAALLTKF
jgi:organic radical activating enzyme